MPKPASLPPSMFFTVDPAGVVLSVNEFGAQQLGYTAQELVGESVLRVFYEADTPQALAHVEECLAHPGRVFQWELRKVRKDGSLLWVKEVARTVQSPDRKPVILIVCEDITDVRRLEEQLRHAQKMDAIGTLSGGVAHDFNNLLTVIKGYSNMVLSRAPDEEIRADIEAIDEAAERAASLTRQLLAFSRRQVLQPKVLNLNALVANMDKMLRRMIGADVEIITVTDPDLGSVKADPGQIEQVIMNLAVNARDAMPHGGKLTLETANADLDETYARDHIGVQPGPHVMLAVSDTGIGMDAKTQARIFEPFFTTKELGKGTGMGLAMIYGIVKQSSGSIWVYSERGHGTTFKVYLPRVDEQADRLPREERPAATVRGTETIVLVEDDRQVRELARSILTVYGYSVLVAENTQSVAPMCEQYAGRIHLLLTDVVMPEISSKELLRQVVVRQPDIKVLYMSGYTTNAIVHYGVLDTGTFFLQKPFTPTALVSKVREVLDKPRTA
jgi:two-component system cell cycle sensor histidine kinase/response regulator CckA